MVRRSPATASSASSTMAASASDLFAAILHQCSAEDKNVTINVRPETTVSNSLFGHLIRGS